MEGTYLLEAKNKKAIVIVAHPDDETIWMGGCLLRYRNIAWTCFSLCRASDRDRAPKFRRVCERYNANCVIADLDDDDKLSLEDATFEAEKLIQDRLQGKSFDYVFCHGASGEYGHERHLAVNRAVNNLLSSKILCPEAIFYFAYENDEKRDYKVVSSKEANLLVELTDKEYREKKRIVSEMYGYQMDGIDVGYCTNPESFKLLKYIT